MEILRESVTWLELIIGIDIILVICIISFYAGKWYYKGKLKKKE